MTPWIQGAGRIPLQLATVIAYFIARSALFLASRLLLSHDDQGGPPSKPPLFLQDKVSGIIPLQLATVIAFHTSLPDTRGKNVSLCTGLPYPVANPVLYDSFTTKNRQNSAAVGNRDCICIGQTLLTPRLLFFGHWPHHDTFQSLTTPKRPITPEWATTLVFLFLRPPPFS